VAPSLELKEIRWDLERIAAAESHIS
jgi:hypothetical protein